MTTPRMTSAAPGPRRARRALLTLTAAAAAFVSLVAGAPSATARSQDCGYLATSANSIPAHTRA
ncbi:hypothetical protein [Streptomyces sp. NPDC001502]|uniref:hypothetical protein n=1 Tax=Streptomyces sp. NPDC001502 TaxID=3364578 RepID=UPI0036BDCED6